MSMEKTNISNVLEDKKAKADTTKVEKELAGEYSKISCQDRYRT